MPLYSCVVIIILDISMEVNESFLLLSITVQRIKEEL